MQQHPFDSAPAGSKLPLYIGVAAILAGASIALFVWGLGVVGANSDYICTKVVSDDAPCANGSWGEWVTISIATSSANGAVTRSEQRTYTGTHTVSRTIQYLSGRTRCDAGYTEEKKSDTWGENWSGIQNGSVVTVSSACQIQQARTLVQSQNVSNVSNGNTGLLSQITELTSYQADTGSTTRNVASALLDVRPKLVARGNPTTVRWEAGGVLSCTVTGTNGDAWSGLSGRQVSSPILARTVYTLDCKRRDNANNRSGDDFIYSATVDIAPQFQEQ